MKKHNVSDPSTEGQTSVEIQGTTKKGKPVVRKRQLSADKVYDIIAEEEEATQILNVVAESIVQYKRKSAKV